MGSDDKLEQNHDEIPKEAVHSHVENRLKKIFKDGFNKVKGLASKSISSDWVFLALLGVLMALCSFAMDYCIEKIQAVHLWLFTAAAPGHTGAQYVAWVGFTLILVLFSAGFCHMVAPQAIGSGIPEMKTILRGVVLPEYLTFRTLISKVVGLTLCLGSGIPMGKEGPFVHISSIMVTLMCQLISGFQEIYKNESRKVEMLSAACAVGVACTFGAPIGGVLFSIEVTSVYFAVRNYWRAFFAATCSAIIFRLAAVWSHKETTIVAFYKTSFLADFPFAPQELIFYALVGVACGFGGPLFVYVNGQIATFVRHQKFMKTLLAKNHFIYPAFAALLISSLTFPAGYGQFIVGEMAPKAAISDLFSNFSWSDPEINVLQADIVKRWSPQNVPYFVTLTLYILYYFFAAAFSATMPVPNGIFIPVFAIGAAFGRIIGELMYLWLPTYFGNDAEGFRIVPGSYALVGAAAFSGSVTHTVSTAMIVFELTGQILYMVPVMLGVLIANAIASYLQPSFYDSVIRMKKLPYLPDLLPTGASVHNIFVRDFMQSNVKFVTLQTTYSQLQDMLISLPRLKTFPLVESSTSSILLGSIPRSQLCDELEEQVGEKARRQEAECLRRKRSEQSRLEEAALFQSITGDYSKNTLSHRRRSITDGAIGLSPARFHFTPVSPQSLDRLQVLSDRKANYLQTQKRKRATSPNFAKASFSIEDENQHPTVSSATYLETPSISAQSTLAKTASLRSMSQTTISGALRNLVRKLHGRRHKDEQHIECDLDVNERKVWEKERLRQVLNFERLQIDNAPFQLVEQTSLYKVHSLFSLLGLSRAYVTSLGRLVGVVCLKELRQALEKSQSVFKTETELTADMEHQEDNVLDKNTIIREGFMRVALKPVRKSASMITLDAVALQSQQQEKNRLSASIEIPVQKPPVTKKVPEIRIDMPQMDIVETDNAETEKRCAKRRRRSFDKSSAD